MGFYLIFSVIIYSFYLYFDLATLHNVQLFCCVRFALFSFVWFVWLFAHVLFFSIPILHSQQNQPKNPSRPVSRNGPNGVLNPAPPIRRRQAPHNVGRRWRRRQQAQPILPGQRHVRADELPLPSRRPHEPRKLDAILLLRPVVSRRGQKSGASNVSIVCIQLKNGLLY